MELITVYEHKRVRINNETKDLLKIVQVTYAEIKDDYAILNVPKGKKVKKFPKLVSDIEDEDYVYNKINTKMIQFVDNNLNEDEILEKVQHLLLNVYYEIYEDNGTILCTKKIFDKNIKADYDRYLIPSLNKKMEVVFQNKGKNGSIYLTPDIKKQILERKNSFKLKNETGNKNISDYDIKGMYSQLKEIIFGQDKQLRTLLAHIIKNTSLSYLDCDVEMIKTLRSNILLMGPTGTGKTLIIENVAKMLQMPYVIIDAKRYTSNGYVGEDVESILINLYYQFGGNMEKVNHAIVFIDEFDKLCEIKDERSHITTTDVQESLLKWLDGTVIHKTVRLGTTENPLVFDTSKMTFVLAGAFTKIFEQETTITLETLKRYGMLSEIAGRIGPIVTLNKPSKNDFRDALLHGKYSYLNLFNTYLKMIHIDSEVKEEFIDMIVDQAFENNSGYRGLKQAIIEYTNESLFDLMSGDIQKLVYQKKQ